MSSVPPTVVSSPRVAGSLVARCAPSPPLAAPSAASGASGRRGWINAPAALGPLAGYEGARRVGWSVPLCWPRLLTTSVSRGAPGRRESSRGSRPAARADGCVRCWNGRCRQKEGPPGVALGPAGRPVHHRRPRHRRPPAGDTRARCERPRPPGRGGPRLMAPRAVRGSEAPAKERTKRAPRRTGTCRPTSPGEASGACSGEGEGEGRNCPRSQPCPPDAGSPDASFRPHPAIG